MLRSRFCGYMALMLLGANAAAATYCVNDGSELRSALVAAGNNGANDEIRVATGTHEVNSGDTAFAYTTNENFGLSIIGGYNSSNTANLARMCAAARPTYHVADPDCLVSADDIRHRPVGVGLPGAQQTLVGLPGRAKDHRQ